MAEKFNWKSPQALVVYVLLILGLFYVALPHTTHLALGLDFGLDHYTHMVLGIIFIVLGVAYYAFVAKKFK